MIPLGTVTQQLTYSQGSTLLNDLVSWWTLDEENGSRVDSHGTNDLADNGTVLYGTGKIGKAADFVSANSEYLRHASNIAFDATDAWTACGWFNLDNVVTRNELFCIVDSANQNRVIFEFNTTLRVLFYTNTWEYLYMTPTPSAATWYFWTLTYDPAVGTNGTLSIKINDGTADTLTLVQPITQTTTNKISLGANTQNNYLDGLLDEYAIWQRVLTAGEITELYNSGNGITYTDLREGDPYSIFNSLHLHMDGTDGATTFTDSSVNALIPTVNGDAQIDTAVAKFGTGSGLFDGVGDYLSYSPNSAFDFSSGDFFVEAFIYRTANTNTYAAIMASGNTSYTTDAVYFTVYGNSHGTNPNKLAFGGFTIGSALVVSTTTLAVDTWYHVAVGRVADQLLLFVDGVLEDTATSSGNVDFSTNGTLIGANGWDGTNRFFQGHIDELRVTKGYCRYKDDFTVPSSAYPDAPVLDDPDIYKVSLLLHMNGVDASTDFVDTSIYERTPLSVGANQQIDTAQSKFGGASGLFDGAGDYLSYNYSADIGQWREFDFTVECWVYASTSWSGWSTGSGIPSLYGNMTATSVTNYWSFGPESGGKLRFHYFGSAGNRLVDSTGTLPTGQWVHIAFVNDNGTIRLFIDGTEDGGEAVVGTPNFSSGTPCTLGQYANVCINGWVDDFRITKGVARYTGNFTVPSTEHPDPPLLFGPDDGFLYDMVGWWTLDETTGYRIDSHIANHLSDVGATSYVAGKIGNAADFIPTDFLSTAQGKNVKAGDRDWSFAVWVNPDVTTGDPYILMNGTQDSGAISGYDFYLTFNSNAFAIRVGVGGAWQTVTETTVGTVSTGTWYFVCGYYEAATNTLGISVNNNTPDTITVSGTPNDNMTAAILRLGSQRSGYGAFDGKLDEVGAWNRLLTGAERTALYNSGNGITYSNF